MRPEAGLEAVRRSGKGELGAAVAQVYGTRVIEQRCIFHKLRNVADKAREDRGFETHREAREQLLEQASVIYQAQTAAQARERLNAFASTWQEQAPKAVATLERDFEQTIAFYRLAGIARELVRKFRQACCFSSRRGAEVAIYLQVQRLHARWTKSSWPQTARSLSLAFY